MSLHHCKEHLCSQWTQACLCVYHNMLTARVHVCMSHVVVANVDRALWLLCSHAGHDPSCSQQRVKTTLRQPQATQDSSRVVCSQCAVVHLRAASTGARENRCWLTQFKSILGEKGGKKYRWSAEYTEFTHGLSFLVCYEWKTLHRQLVFLRSGV